METSRFAALAILVLLLLMLPGLAAADDQLTWGVHVSLAPTWFDPAETSGIITPYMILYALHDALVKPMPGNSMAPSLAESWSASPDGRTYDFTLRAGATFHNGDAVTADDVKFSFERYRGAGAKPLKERVAGVDVVDRTHVRFRLKAPWPDFLLFYTNASGAGWIVPRRYVERVGDEGFKKAPIGAGPYKFVSFTPGVELIVDAFDRYWRKAPNVKRLVFRSIPDETTRLAALKNGEVDVAYSIRGELAQELEKTPGLTLKPTVIQAPFWVYFADQWDTKSPWHDQRVRVAANQAIDRAAINDALTLGHSRLSMSIVPTTFEFFWSPPAYRHDPAAAKKLLAAAGYPNGFDAGEYFCDASYANLAEAVVGDLQRVGIDAKLRPLERAAFFSGYGSKKFKNLIQGASGAFGNAATRMEAFVVSGGTYVYGSYPDLDGLYREQASELDRKKREATLHRMQQLLYDKAVYAPLWELAFLNGVGPRVRESALGLIPGHAYSAPYEDVDIKR
ncbi:MAG TPA: ABC transporter substrate-binding protein [Methylomirabilota bacterium]|jgi:peptide/nickel transport system substrate-binding protein|nr:ABC transporter substrate-binding protein [Methylomirabilota bacterium]